MSSPEFDKFIKNEVYISLFYDDPDSEAPRAYFRIAALEEVEGEIAMPREMDVDCGALHLLADYLELEV